MSTVFWSTGLVLLPIVATLFVAAVLWWATFESSKWFMRRYGYCPTCDRLVEDAQESA